MIVMMMLMLIAMMSGVDIIFLVYKLRYYMIMISCLSIMSIVFNNHFYLSHLSITLSITSIYYIYLSHLSIASIYRIYLSSLSITCIYHIYHLSHLSITSIYHIYLSHLSINLYHMNRCLSTIGLWTSTSWSSSRNHFYSTLY